MLFSLLYAPMVFLALRHFDIERTSIVIFLISGIWLFLMKKENKFSLLLPLFYMLVALISFFLGSFWVLKLMPLFISSFFSIFILVSYLQKNSIILHFAEKFSKEPISLSEKAYIHRSTLFWFFVSLINVSIHLWAFLEPNLDFWLYYSSVGWYGIFLLAGLIQYLHRHYVFLRSENA